MRRILLNRYTIVLGTLALVVIAWNLYVATHNHGRIAGRVIGTGRPASRRGDRDPEGEDADHARAESGRPDGWGGESSFSWAKHAHHFVLEAVKDGVGKSERTAYRRAFRGQNLSLAAPLRLQP